MQAWNETNRILCQTSKERSHDFKNHETFYLGNDIAVGTNI